MKVTDRLVALSAVVITLALPVVASATACIVTPGELQTATGRSFNAGQESKAVDGSAVCSYTEADAPKRRLVINVIESRGKAQIESRKRLLSRGDKPIDLPGVGDAAYYNGTSAGVLSGDRLIAFTNLQRPGTPKAAPEKITALLQAALGRLPR